MRHIGINLSVEANVNRYRFFSAQPMTPNRTTRVEIFYIDRSEIKRKGRVAIAILANTVRVEKERQCEAYRKNVCKL